MSVHADKSVTSSQAASPSPASPNPSSGDAPAAPDAPSTAASTINSAAGFVLPPGMASMAGMQFVPYFPPMTTVAAPGGETSEGNAQVQAAPGGAMMIHPAFLQQMYSYPYGMMPGMKLKRKQVKNACTNCQKACKKCGDERPCTRCVKYGIAEECLDSVRKERRKGVKRGSYKKKPMPGEEEETANATTTAAVAAQFLPAAAYSAQLYSQWAAAALGATTGAKPGEGTAGYYPYFIAAPMPQGDASASSDGTNVAGAAPALVPPMFYPGFALPGSSAEQPSTARDKASKQDKESNEDPQEEDELMDADDNVEEEEEDNEDEEEEDDYEEREASSKRRRSKKKRKGN